MMLGYTSLTQPTGLGEITFEKMLGYISLTQPTRLGAIAPSKLATERICYGVRTHDKKLKIRAKIR